MTVYSCNFFLQYTSLVTRTEIADFVTCVDVSLPVLTDCINFFTL